MRTRSKILASAPLLALAASLTACSSDSGSDKNDPLVVGASPVPHADILRWVNKNLAPKHGLKIKVKEFQDYVQPNTATADGSIDANFFQHKPYLEDFNKSKVTDLTPVAAVHLEPLGLYSKKTSSVRDLTKGATVALPKDVTNEGRALQLLAKHKVITLKSGAGVSATPKDIAKNPKDLKFKELKAAQLPRALDDVDASVINGNYAIQAKLKPSDDALLLEKAKGNPYANILAVKKDNKDDPRVQKLAKLLHSPQLKKHLKKTYPHDSVLPAF